MKCCEYKLLHFRAGLGTSSSLPNDLNLEFDKLGGKGLEYVEIRPIQSVGLFFGMSSNTKSFVAVFRRDLP